MNISHAIVPRGFRAARLLCTAALGFATSGAPAQSPVVIDGVFDDWADVPVATVDPLDAPEAEIDFGAVRVTHDARFLHVLFYQAHEVNLQRLDGRAHIVFDADGDPGTGERTHGVDGADLVVTFSPPNRRDANRPGMGVGVRLWSERGWLDISPYELGVTFGPTYAHRQVEFRIERAPDAPVLRHVFAGAETRMQLVLTDARDAVLDETDVIGHAFEVAPGGPRAAAPPARLERAAGTDVRVVSWNTRYGSLVQQPEVARRLIRALDPDVVLLQEQTDANTAADVVRVFNGRDTPNPRDRYVALVGAGGGNLRSASVARVPIERLDAVEPIPYPYQDGRYLRACGGAVEVAGRRLLLVSTHLKCCGRIGDRSDDKRENETQAIRAAVIAARGAGGIDGVLVGGDLNLVGGRRPLEILGDSIDVNGSNLAIVDAMQLDGRSNATWTDDEQPFVAGRLDYVLYSDSTLDVRRTFVFDTADLDAAALARHGLEADDATTVSDHLPVVVDLKWRDRAVEPLD